MNFDFLKGKKDFEHLYDDCRKAENYCYCDEESSLLNARKALEFVVDFVYQSCTGKKDPKMDLIDKLKNRSVINYFNDSQYIDELHKLRKNTNAGVHGYSDEEGFVPAINVLEDLYYAVCDFLVNLGELEQKYPLFKAPKIINPEVVVSPEVEKDKKEPEFASTEVIKKYASRMRETKFEIGRNIDQTENKKKYIEASFTEANMPLLAIANQALPNSIGSNVVLASGKIVDYVIYGSNCKPLAIIESKISQTNPYQGRKIANEWADELKIKYGYKPVVYCACGYQYFCDDQLGFKPRRVYGLHTIDELEMLIQRANLRKDISNPSIDKNIIDRDYQIQAVNAACNAYNNRDRNSLLVMATGTGKTRVAIALADILTKNNWVKNILFLADRKSLVKQAQKSFTKLLPNLTSSIYVGDEINRDNNARVIFSTYQTMIGLVDTDKKEFGIGRFDLIIIDEAHRSIFSKYGSLFKYFDAMLLGLTATPRDEDNRSTYEVFDKKNNEPDFAYELKQAVDEKHLVGFHVLKRTTKSIQEHSKYSDFTEEEKEKIDDLTESLEDAKPGTMYSVEVIDKSTIAIMLNDLMQNGLKVEGDTKIGKTIIFAPYHEYAKEIVKQFNILYPEYGKGYCALIDSTVEEAQQLIENFSLRDNKPQIAVSVDMLDTGIDVPDILNLVFFKKVLSKIKFLQMIGRGTRLSKDIYGPESDKKGFLILDYFDNFEFFDMDSLSFDVQADKLFHQKPLDQRISNSRYTLVRKKLEEKEAMLPENYIDQIIDDFTNKTINLVNDEISVNLQLNYVNKYRDRNSWLTTDPLEMTEITQRIIPLIRYSESTFEEKCADSSFYWLYNAGLSDKYRGNLLGLYNNGVYTHKFQNPAQVLLKMQNIPEIRANEQMLNDIASGKILEHYDIDKWEEQRKVFRTLAKYIDHKTIYLIISTNDVLIDDGNNTRTLTFEEKVQDYLNNYKNSNALMKIHNLEQLTLADANEIKVKFKEFGTDLQCQKLLNGKDLFVYIRKEIGIDSDAINVKFGSFLNTATLTQKQYDFCNQMIEYAKLNGEFKFEHLLTVSPFDDEDIAGLFKSNIGYIKEIINGLKIETK